MATKTYNVEPLGEFTIYKRKGTSRLSMRFVGGKLRVIQPTWLPYVAGVKFAQSQIGWVVKHRPTQTIKLYDGMEIGKAHNLCFENGDRLRSRITENEIIIYIPNHLSPESPEVQKLCLGAIKRTLKKQAELHLPDRLAHHAQNYGFKYRSVHCKSMRTRWGSCNHDRVICLNIFLMMASWEQIDYVLIHELVHTEHFHHGTPFWARVAEIMPDYKYRRKQLRELQKSIAPLQ